jgi:hypothetical protein
MRNAPAIQVRMQRRADAMFAFFAKLCGSMSKNLRGSRHRLATIWHDRIFLTSVFWWTDESKHKLVSVLA